MKKTFSTIVPNTLYSNDFSEGKKSSFVYNGPDSITVVVRKSDGIILNNNFVEGDAFDEENALKVTVNPSTTPNIAYLLLPNPITPENYTFEDEVLDDGSVYKNRTNPSLHDYYNIRSYNIEEGKFNLNSIVRNSESLALTKAKEIKTTLETGFLARIEIDNGGNDAVKNFLLDDGINVDKTSDEIVTEIQNYVSSLDSFINQESKRIIWKYETPPVSVIPELPDYLTKFF